MSDTRLITSSVHNYTIHFEENLAFLPSLLSADSAIFIVDKNVFELYAAELVALSGMENLLLLEAVEENKTLAAAEGVYDKIIGLRPTKKTKIVSIGGGITQDVSGFVASTFYRGLHWIYVPTTLLAQADSCMGSKTSLNYKSYKNILGTFYPPHKIYIATVFTKTLKDEDFYSGMGEIAKLHAMGGMDKVAYLSERLRGVHARDIPTMLDLTRSSLDIKWSYMEGDEFDQGKRNMLNYGHCFGHAIETATQYRIPHGQAVVIGMILANKVALDKKHISERLSSRLDELFFAVLKSDLGQLKHMSNELVVNAMKQDKKRTGSGLPLIMHDEQLNFFKISDMTEEEAVQTLRQFQDSYCNG